MSRSLPVDRLAAFDQAISACAEAVDALIAVHRESADGDGREVCIVSLACFLQHEISHTACAELLATAIDRLTHPTTL